MKRYDRKNKSYVEVERPSLIRYYNHNIGGDDKPDMLLSLYRTHLKTKKWHKWILFNFLVVAVVKSWLLYKKKSYISMLYALRSFQDVHCRRANSSMVNSVIEGVPEYG